MAMTFADYIVLSDKPIRLSANPETGHPREKTCRFQLPANFSAETPDTKPVLMFRTEVLDHHDTRLRVFVNPVPTQTNSDGFPNDEDYVTELSKGYFGLHMEALAGNKFKKGQENKLVITISGDGKHRFGDVIIGDIVMLIQREG
jgi:hypothetical protein